jgi:S-disulfanyl-L-cysteine oxidoreductase SoxD
MTRGGGRSSCAAHRRTETRNQENIQMIKCMLAACLLLLHGASAALAQQRSTSSGVFTAEQAKNGERVFQAQCAPCHGADLHSVCPEAPDLTEGAFKYGWQDKTIAYRFQQIRSQMPPGQARSLDDQTYLDIIAYILQFNGIPAGTQKLVPDDAALEQIVITVP